ncbi:MAG: MFS transporter [Alphaproteobacteria bacterium]|nr:MFS transporter [Alphaproteobacteria bacterium]
MMFRKNTGGYRVTVVALLTTATIINSFYRASLSVAAPFIMKEFDVNSAVMGVALSAFFWSYVPGNLIGGRLADRYGTKIVLGVSFVAWSVFSAFTGLAQNIAQVIVTRLGVGFSEGPAFPVCAKIFAGNFPAKERGTVIGINSAGNRVGLALCPIIMAVLITQFGWRAAFLVTGLISLIWVVCWHFFFTDLARSKQASLGTPEQQVRVPWRRILTSKAILALIVVKFSQDFLQWQFLTWVPGYLITGRHFSVIEMGFYTSLAFGVASVAQPGIGFISDWLIRRGWSINRARKTVQVALQVFSATIIVTGFSQSKDIAMFFMVVAITAESTCAGHIWTIIADVIPSKYMGSVGGLINALGAIAGIISPILTGVIAQVTGSFELALTIGGSIILVASVFLLFAVPSLNQQWAEVFDEALPARQVA